MAKFGQGFGRMMGAGLLAISLSACVTRAPDHEGAAAYSPLERDGEIFANPAIPGERPSWKNPFLGLKSAPGVAPAKCLLVVDSGVAANAWMLQRDALSAQGVYDGLHPEDQERLQQKGWMLLPLSNSLYGDRQVKEWAYAQALEKSPQNFEQLKPADRERYQSEVVARHYGVLHQVRVLRLISRPGAMHSQYFGGEKPWATNGLGLFVIHDRGAESIYRIGLIDTKVDPRKEWPWVGTGGSALRYERRAQLGAADWQRLARVYPESRTPASGAQADRMELAVHLGLVENFISHLPECAPN